MATAVTPSLHGDAIVLRSGACEAPGNGRGDSGRDLLLGDVRSLKEKRSVVRPIVAELRRRFAVAAAETGALDLHRRAEMSASRCRARRMRTWSRCSSSCERLVAGRPEVELLVGAPPGVR